MKLVLGEEYSRADGSGRGVCRSSFGNNQYVAAYPFRVDMTVYTADGHLYDNTPAQPNPCDITKHYPKEAQQENNMIITLDCDTIEKIKVHEGRVQVEMSGVGLLNLKTESIATHNEMLPIMFTDSKSRLDAIRHLTRLIEVGES